jgi:hypothetical protein
MSDVGFIATSAISAYRQKEFVKLKKEQHK